MREDYLKNLKRFAAAALALAVTVSALLGCGGGIKAYAGSKNGGAAGDDALFTDVKSTHWAHSEIAAMAEAGVIDGYPDGSFRPSASVTYGEFIKMMYAAVNGDDLIAAAGAGTGSAKAGEKSGAGSRNEHWAAPYYYAALAEGYFDGSSIEIGLLDKKIPRKHMAHASAGVVRTLAAESNSREAKGSAEFSDVLPAGEFAYDIMTACGSGILSGYPDGTFSGNKTLTRAEAASVIKRLAEYKEKALSAAVAAGEEQLAAEGNENEESGLAAGEKKSGKKIVRRVEKPDRLIPVSYEVIESTFAVKGIAKIEHDGDNIKIYSEKEYPFIKIMNTDGSLMKSIGSPEGSFFKEDGMFVYLSVTEGKAFGAEQDEIYMIFDDESERVYKFSGVVL